MQQKPTFAPLTIALGLLWLAAGALFKLFEGSPNDLPGTVKELSPLSDLQTMQAAVMIELAVIGLVIAKPRLGWIFLAGTFATFIAVLYPLVQEGATSCGCFGGNIEIKPEVMMGIDGALLVLMLISMPWRMPKDSGLGMPAFLPFLAVAVLAPWQKIEAESKPTFNPALVGKLRNAGKEATPAGLVEDNPDGGGGEPAGEGTTPPDPDPNVEDPSTTVVGTDNDESEQPEDPTPPAEPPSEGLGEFWSFEPLNEADPERYWVGKNFYETDFASFYMKGFELGLEQGTVPPNSHVVIYRETCEVCSEHLQELWQEVTNGDAKWIGKTIVLARIRELKDATSENLCTVLPESNFNAGIMVEKIQLPELPRGYGITTPYTFDVDENENVQNPVDLRTELGH